MRDGRRATLAAMLWPRISVLLLLAALFIACSGGDDDEPTPTAPPQAAVRSSAPDSIRIPEIAVNARVTLKRLVAGEPLPSPDSPRDVALYEFGADLPNLGGAPGQGGNVVVAGENAAFSGCPGGPPPCLAVFGQLDNLRLGAAIDLTWQGEVYHYQLVALCNVRTREFSDGLYGRTAEEQMTLLTGAGAWTSETGWSHVLIGIAKPAPRTAIEPCPEGTSEGAPG
jgi:hypothetical protein